MTTTPTRPNTSAFFVQSGISFGVALIAMVFAVWFLPVDAWIRGFLALGTLFLVTSSFTLAKCVRDAEEAKGLTTRLDQARVDKLISEHDPFKPIV